MKFITKHLSKEEIKQILKLLDQLQPNHDKIQRNKRFLKDIKSKIFVIAKNKDKIIGFISLKIIFLNLIGYIKELLITKENRGKGIGKELLNEAISLARCKSCKIIFLTVNPKRKEAYKLYKSQGFKNIGHLFVR